MHDEVATNDRIKFIIIFYPNEFLQFVGANCFDYLKLCCSKTLDPIATRHDNIKSMS